MRRKWTVRAHGRQIVLIKRPIESVRHVLMKAFLWALYLPEYADATVEVAVGGRYKPDVISMAEPGPRFWGEAGHVSQHKLEHIARRHRNTHLALARWDTRLDSVVALVRRAIDGVERGAPFDVLIFPADSAERFVDERGEIRLTHDDLVWQRL